jgi:hypothetical protein
MERSQVLKPFTIEPEASNEMPTLLGSDFHVMSALARAGWIMYTAVTTASLRSARVPAAIPEHHSWPHTPVLKASGLAEIALYSAVVADSS